MSTFIMIVLLLVPGFISKIVFDRINKLNAGNGKLYVFIAAGLIYDIVIWLINFAFLRITRSYIDTFAKLVRRFTFLQFTYKYILLALFVSIAIGVISGLIYRFVNSGNSPVLKGRSKSN